MADYDVFGVGNALVDILALVEDSFVTDRDLGKGSMTLVDPAKQGALLNDLEGSELKLRSGWVRRQHDDCNRPKWRQQLLHGQSGR